MKQIHLLFLTIISSIAISVSAQNQIQNGSFEAWSGIDHPTPDGWSSPGEMDGKKPGMWVTQESRHAYVRTGVYSLKLSVDTIQRLGGFNDAFRISTSRDNATSRVSERDSASARFGYFYIRVS